MKLLVLLVIFGVCGTLKSFSQSHWWVPDNCSFSLGNSLTYRTSVSATSVYATTAQMGVEWLRPLSSRYGFSIGLAPGLQSLSSNVGENMRFFADFNLMGRYSISPKMTVSIGLSAWKNFFKESDTTGENQTHDWELETKNETQLGVAGAVRYQLTKRLSTGLRVTYFPRIYALAIENSIEQYVVFKNLSPQISVHYHLSR